ncbi:hypothetical protein AB205_0111980 [Aquarana catesbeiana]|uniref:LRRCT domain-containing protein n=1 Tax=Aquarana catesbeiana TaxID=8400 RepID=A0A2G9P2E6_AQUCT|nr:hypothetical protein AB205_0111980 [Aquarana catesbeiana]
MFQGLPNLVRLEFQTDYLLCDCNLLWMVRWIKAKNITVRETKCSYPKALQGQPIAALKPEQLTCGNVLFSNVYFTFHPQLSFLGHSDDLKIPQYNQQLHLHDGVLS